MKLKKNAISAYKLNNIECGGGEGEGKGVWKPRKPPSPPLPTIMSSENTMNTLIKFLSIDLKRLWTPLSFGIAGRIESRCKKISHPQYNILAVLKMYLTD